MKRSTFFKFRLSPYEKERIERKAKTAELSPSDFIRRELGFKVNRPPAYRPTALLEALQSPGASALRRLGITDEQPDESRQPSGLQQP